MHVHRIAIKNFRLLEDVELYLEQQTTLLVGRNNSGKTSFIELFRRFLSEHPPTFSLEDFSLCVHESFWNAYKKKQDGENDVDVSQALPAIEVRFEIDYSDDLTNFGSLTTFMIDLDETSTTAVVNIRYQLREGRLGKLFENLEFDSTQSEDAQKTTFFREIKTRISKHFHCSLMAISPVDPTNKKSVDWSKLTTLIQSGFIHAQRGLDDITDRDRNTLGRILETLFNAAILESAERDDRSTAQEIDEIVRGIQKTIDDSFSTQLTNLVPSLSPLVTS